MRNYGVTSNASPKSDAIVCMPGAFGTAWGDFEYQLDGGLNPYTVVAIDPRGYGQSLINGQKFGRDYPLDFYERDADDLSAVLRELGLHNAHIVGWSDGAHSAVILASKYPNLAKTLSIFGGSAWSTQQDRDGWDSMRNLDNWSARMRQHLLSSYDNDEEITQRELNSNVDGYLNIVDKNFGDICLSHVHKIHCPTLILHGQKDPICAQDHAEYLKNQIPNAQELYLFPEGKHNIHQKYPDEFNSKIKSFIAANSSPEPVMPKMDKKDVPDINGIAYGFMGSKTLFMALHGGIFDAIEEHSIFGATLGEIFQANSCSVVSKEALRTLLTALTSLNLVRTRQERRVNNDYNTIENETLYYNAPNVSNEMVQTGKYYWGDYLKYQIDMQFYDRMSFLRPTLIQNADSVSEEAKLDDYESWFRNNPTAAKLYTEAQHNGSLATARTLIKRLGFFENSKLLDIGGGSGAFCIALCQKYAKSSATELDLPAVVDTAKNFVGAEKEQIQKRIQLIPGSATEPWDLKNEKFDVVLMSYISGSVPTEELPAMYDQAFSALSPGGRIIIHDFMVNNDRSGPLSSSIWAVAHLAVNPKGLGLSPRNVIEMLEKSGFVAPIVSEMIAGLTKTIVARKP